MKGSQGNRRYRKSFVSSPLWTRSSSSVLMWLRERADSSEVGRIRFSFGSLETFVHFRNFNCASKNRYIILRFQFQSIIFQLILIRYSYKQTQWIYQYKFMLLFGDNQEPIGLKKNDLFDIESVYDFCLKLSILQVITSIPRTWMLDGYRRQGTSRHQG